MNTFLNYDGFPCDGKAMAAAQNAAAAAQNAAYMHNNINSGMRNCGMNNLSGLLLMQSINVSTETAYPNKNGNAMNKKLEAAKKWLKERR